jgi:ABC-type glutathione transport system ATPase component
MMTQAPPLQTGPSPLIEVNGIIKHFPIRKSLAFLSKERAVVHAVDDVSLQILRGETFGLVGESGCGKTTLGRIILRLIDPSAGTILFEGTNVLNLRGQDLKNFRKRAQIVFQNPFGSLGPRMKVRDIVGYPAKLHGLVNSIQDLTRVAPLTGSFVSVVWPSRSAYLTIPCEVAKWQPAAIPTFVSTIHPTMHVGFCD